MALTTRQIAELTGGRLVGDGDVRIDAMETVDQAVADQLTLVGHEKYLTPWRDSAAAAALVKSTLAIEPNGRPVILVDDVDLAAAKVLELLAPPIVQPAPGVDARAALDPTATLGANVRIGPGCYVGPRVSLADGVVLHANVTVMDDSQIGEHTIIWPGVVVRERTLIGQRCQIHPNTTIGADGFGYRPTPDGKGIIKIPQIGHVQIGDDVEIGSCTCIDRGKFSATVIGDGTKIDNLVQIAHNVHIGRCVIIAGTCGIGGSVTIGDGVVLGASVGVADHLTIGPGARLAARAGVMNNVPAGETWAGEPAQPRRDAMRMYSSLRQLDQMVRDWKKSRRQR